MFYVVEIREPQLETDPTRMCALLVGLPAVRVVGVAQATLAVHRLRSVLER